MSDHPEICGKSVWLLVDGFVRPGFADQWVRFCAQVNTPDDRGVLLPVMPNGRVHELIEVPADLAKTGGAAYTLAGEPLAQLTIRRVSRLERTWRMANRVFDAFTRIRYSVRQACRVGILLALFNLPEAYRRISTLRWVEDYPHWYRRFGIIGEQEKAAIANVVAGFSRRPRFYLLVREAGASPAALAYTLDSLARQLYDEYVYVVFGDAETVEVPGGGSVDAEKFATQQAWLDRMNAALVGAAGNDWFLSIRAGDRLPVHSLAWFAAELQGQADISVMYSDHDVVDGNGSPIDACFKPDWSLTHYRATQYMGDALLIKGESIASAGGFDADSLRHGFYDLLLRVLDAGDRDRVPFHVPAVLLNSTLGAPLDGPSADWSLAAVERHLRRRHLAATVTKLPAGGRRCSFVLPAEPPLVSIIIPTRDCLEMLRQCVSSLLERTTYKRFEILVIDNRSRAPETLDYLELLAKYPCIRVLRYDRPFNYSAMNNFAVNEAGGELLCLLNNDTEVIAPDWLDEMVGHILQPGVGAVGAKLYYPDGRVQHAGDVVGAGGCANHLHSMIARDAPGYCNRAILAQELSAVTAACLLTRKALYLELGGLDARFLRVAFNDVDYCLRLGAAGYKVVWTPHAELFHHESVSRGKDSNWRKILRAESEVFVMRRRWQHVMLNDPFYNPNLSYIRPDFSMGHFRQVEPPWQS